jgi:hypothetical protein
MKCDIILEVGNGNVINITRDSSQVELESLDDIIKFLNENKRGELRQIINDLQSSRKTISITDKSNFLKFGIFPNASFDDLKSLYPDVFSDIDSIDQPYHYLLRDRLTYNGEKLYGRIVIKPSAKKGETPVEGLKDTVLYIFRNENDVKAFAKTERTRKKAEAILTDNNEIKDDHLKKVYESKINAIAKHFGFDKTKDFINNYLNNKSLYKVPKD